MRQGPCPYARSPAHPLSCKNTDSVRGQGAEWHRKKSLPSPNELTRHPLSRMPSGSAWHGVPSSWSPASSLLSRPPNTSIPSGNASGEGTARTVGAAGAQESILPATEPQPPAKPSPENPQAKDAHAGPEEPHSGELQGQELPPYACPLSTRTLPPPGELLRQEVGAPGLCLCGLRGCARVTHAPSVIPQLQQLRGDSALPHPPGHLPEAVGPPPPHG